MTHTRRKTSDFIPVGSIHDMELLIDSLKDNELNPNSKDLLNNKEFILSALEHDANIL